MSDAYDPELQSIVLKAADELNLSDRVRPNGTYCFVSGPCYESKIECRFLRSIGGDSVGMSTVPEVIAAKHCGMKILGLSLITNKVIVNNDKDAVHANHAEVLAAVGASGLHVEAIVKRIVTKEIIGEFLSRQPAVNYRRKTHAIAAEPAAAKVVSTGCSASSCAVESKKCCTDCKCGSNCEGYFALFGIAALAIGLFTVLKHRHH